MQQSIKLGGRNVSYLLRVSMRVRRIRLTIHSNGSCVVAIPQGVPKIHAEQFLLRNSAWILGKLEVAKNFGGRVLPHGTRGEYLKYKESARTLAEERLRYFNTHYNVSWGRVSIRNQKSRWGSCSKKGNINFNFKIAILPPHLADYIIVHELCHLSAFNHSKKFWDLVAETIPNHKEVRRELKTLRH